MSDGVFYFGGAGILNAATGILLVSRSAISGNWVSEADLGGGLTNLGQATLDRTVLDGNYAASGGAIWNLGVLDVVDSRISGNGARFDGAALMNMAAASLRRTTIDGNVTAGAGGAIVNGIWDHSEALLALDNATVSGNLGYSYSGSIINYAGRLQISSSTIADNFGSQEPGAVGGITALAEMRLRSTIVSNPGTGNCAGSIASLGNNLDSDGSCALSASGDLSNVNPLLGPLADNGGPTPTHALHVGSPAIDRIAMAQCTGTFDQRHISRPYPHVGLCDIGAYELSPPGDIHFIIADIKDLGRAGQVTKEQEWALIQLLKPAELAAMIGRPTGACLALDDFTTAVTAYVDSGGLSAAAAQALLADARRVRGLLCP